MSQEYYIQNVRPHLSDKYPMIFWTKNNHGWRYNIGNARVFSQAEVDQMPSIVVGTEIAWPVEYIQGRVANNGRVYQNKCDIKKALEMV